MPRMSRLHVSGLQMFSCRARPHVCHLCTLYSLPPARALLFCAPPVVSCRASYACLCFIRPHWLPFVQHTMARQQNSAVSVRQGSRLCYASRQSSQKWSCARLAGTWYGPKGCSTSLLMGGAAAAAPWAAQAQLFRCASPSNREVLAQQLPGQRTRSGGLVDEGEVVSCVPPQVKGGTCTS